MFRPSQYITRAETVESVSRRFQLKPDIVMVFLNFYYPRVFFPLVSIEEYALFVKAIQKTLTK